MLNLILDGISSLYLTKYVIVIFDKFFRQKKNDNVPKGKFYRNIELMNWKEVCLIAFPIRLMFNLNISRE